MNVDLERLLIWILLLFMTALMLTGVYALTQDHEVRYYYLSEQENKLMIVGDIDWGVDESVDLDRSVTYYDALQIVDIMNLQLRQESNRP